MNITSYFQIITPATAACTSGHILPTKAHTSALMASGGVKAATEKPSQAAHAECILQSNINPLSLNILLLAKCPCCEKKEKKQNHRVLRRLKMKSLYRLLNKASMPCLV